MDKIYKMSKTDGVVNSFESEEIEQDTLNQTNHDGEEVESENKEKNHMHHMLSTKSALKKSYEEALKDKIV